MAHVTVMPNLTAPRARSCGHHQALSGRASPTTASTSPSLPGEIHAVLGENGAGKSTLMKIIYGVVKPDAGTIRWEGKPVTIANPARARKLGIGMVFQHFSLFETLTVAENIALALDERHAGGDCPRASATCRALRPAARPGRVTCTRCRSASASASRSSRCLLQDPRAADHGRADVGADAAGGREAVRDAAPARRRRLQHPLHQPQARRDPRAVPPRDGAARGAGSPARAIRDTNRRRTLARMMIGGDLPHPRHRERARGRAALVVDDLTLAADDPFGTSLS